MMLREDTDRALGKALLILWGVVVATLLAVFAVSCVPAEAQSRHDQMEPHWYDILCCSGRDCAPITTRNVDIGPAGIKVTLRPEDHDMVTKEITTLFAWDDDRLRESEDFDFHACVRDMAAYTRPLDEIPDDQLFLCLYVPPMPM